MIFAPDTEVALAGAAALANTAHGGEQLPTVASLDGFLRTWGWTGARDRGRAELDAVRALRPVLEDLWRADERSAVDTVNGILRDARALPQLLEHDGLDYHLHATPLEADLSIRMAVEAAMAFVDVIRMKQLDRLRVCEADDCCDLHVDLSRNRSRRFCDVTCGNRMNVAAYRARRGG